MRASNSSVSGSLVGFLFVIGAMMKDLWMHQAGADDEHLTSSRCSCRGDPYRFIAVLGSALPLNVHHRTGHVADSEGLHDLCLAGRSA